MEEQKENLEDLCDKRIELLTKTVNKCRKRKKVSDDDDDYVSSVFLHAEKMRCKVRNATIDQFTNILKYVFWTQCLPPMEPY